MIFLKNGLFRSTIQRREAFSVTYRRSIMKDVAGIKKENKTNDLPDSLRNYVFNISCRYTQFRHPIQLFEHDLHDLWFTLIHAATVTDA
jgi:hypothetical protein